MEGFDVDVSVQHHTSAEIETPQSVKARGSGLDERRGDTTQLTQELGANLPMLTCRYDARGAPEYVEEWCAYVREGTDGSLSSQGVRRFRTLGSFDNRAESEKVRRKVKNACSNAQALSQSLEYHPLSAQTHDSSPAITVKTNREDRVPSSSATTVDERESGEESRFNFTQDTGRSSDSDETRFTFHE